LFVLEVISPLRILDISEGEGDLLNLQYHKLDSFQQAKQDGYDGVKIDDFAQSETFGNYGHSSIGLFNKDKIKIKKVIDASHPDEGESREMHSNAYKSSLNESRTVLYHDTSPQRLYHIMKGDKFILSPAHRGGPEGVYSKIKNYPYYFSMARSKQSRYFAFGYHGALLHIDGYKLQQRYPIFPYDY